MDLHAWITQQVDAVERSVEEDVLPSDEAAPLLRRCEADRRVLARHCVDPDEADSPMYATACRGCERWGEYDYPNTDNLNDCPELLDLAYAHGLTDEILAGLDRPTPPEPKPRKPHPDGLMGTLRDAFDHALGSPLITTSEVPAALRGPRWKP